MEKDINLKRRRTSDSNQDDPDYKQELSTSITDRKKMRITEQKGTQHSTAQHSTDDSASQKQDKSQYVLFRL